MSQPSDDQLIERCLEASQTAADAFDALYARHAKAVYAFLRGLHRGDEHAASDALQETFFRFYKSLARFEQGRAVRPWLLRIARNVSLDAFKKASARKEQAQEPEAISGLAGGDKAPGPVEQAARREAAQILREAMADLPRQELAVFLLKHDQGLTYEQTAEALACSVRTAKYRMRAALERLGREAERRGVVA
jgi:RNA polymerase sigma-70 factor (ECF subfamily)